MTEQEAMGYLKILANRIPLKFYTDKECQIYDDFSQVTIKALEKQVSQKPRLDGDGYAPDGTFAYDQWICPRCNQVYEIDYDDYEYCPKCGQRIDWSDDEC